MSGCILQFTRNSPLRTTVVDQATGHAKYQIDTPRRIARRVTRIRKLDSSAQHPLHSDDADSDSGDDITDKGESKSKKDEGDWEGEHETEGELPESSDEIARIYWNWFSSDRIIFRGKITSRSDFLLKCGKMKGYVESRCGLCLVAESVRESGATCSLGQMVFSTDGQWAHSV